jgi:hypothetical protein
MTQNGVYPVMLNVSEASNVADEWSCSVTPDASLRSLETLADTQMLHYVQHDKGGVSCPSYATRGIGNSLETLADTQMLHYVQHDKGGVSCPSYATRGIGNSE